MPKKIVQDILPGKKRSIKNICIERSDNFSIKALEKESRKMQREDKDVEPIFVKKSNNKKRKSALKYVLSFIIIIFSVAIILIALSLSYSKAIVAITPKILNFDINGTYTAKKDSTGNDLIYEVITATEELRSTVSATKGPLLQTKSKGTMIIYSLATTSQVLVAGTRISNADGLIYRTTKTITVPAKKTKPGSADVVVIADKAGQSFNLKAVDIKYDFRLLGYIGTYKYDNFYAKIKTDLVGGYSGSKITIAPDIQNSAVKSLQDLMKEKLTEKIKKTVPQNYTYYDNAYSIKYEVLEPVMKDGGKADIVVRGTIYGAIFKTDLFIKFLAGSEVKKFPSETYIITGDKNLTYKLSNVKEFSAEKGSPMIFVLKGNISIKGTFSESKLKNELRGLKLEQSRAVFNKYGSISSAHSLITPFWLRSFPDTVEKIEIEYKK